MRFLAASVLAAMSALTGCVLPGEDAEHQTVSDQTSVRATAADPNATPATRTVLANLHAFDFASVDPFDRRVMIGQQDSDFSNRASYGKLIVPDIEKVTGKTPAVVGYELSNADAGALTMFDPAVFRAGRAVLRDLILAQHRKGALVTLVWHMRCPKSSPSDRDLYAPNECPSDYRLEELLMKKSNGREGVHFQAWRAILDELAELLWSLKDENGELIPVQLRPFHELTGNWFWWGRQNGASNYAAAFREMVHYLREGRGLHNVLWVFNPASPSTDGAWESFYPGDDIVDVVSFDAYDQNDGRFARTFEADLSSIGNFAKRHGKVAAVAEVGRDLNAHGLNSNPTWFTQSLLAPLKRHGFAYVALWRNAPWEKYVPEPGDGAIADDLVRLERDEATLFSGTHDLYQPLHARPGT